MGTSLDEFKNRKFRAVYIIYDTDVVGTEADIERMSPLNHMSAGYNPDDPKHRLMTAVAKRFTLTEEDDQYNYGYLAEETKNDAYLPVDDMPDDYEGDGYQGRHRKWVGELTAYEWRLFADTYFVDLNDNGYPVNYEDTMGSLTEHGLLFAVSVDNSEGWQDYSGPTFVNSSFYVSFAA